MTAAATIAGSGVAILAVGSSRSEPYQFCSELHDMSCRIAGKILRASDMQETAADLISAPSMTLDALAGVAALNKLQNHGVSQAKS
jgi:hypothetical protein